MTSRDSTGRIKVSNPLRSVAAAVPNGAKAKGFGPKLVANPNKAMATGGSMDVSMEQLQQMKLAKYEEIFSKFDVDDSGTVETSELGQILAQLGFTLSEDDLKAVMTEVDENGDGRLDFAEFCAAMDGNTLGSKLSGDMTKMVEDLIFGDSKMSRKHSALDEGEANPNSCCGLLHPESKRRRSYDILQMFLLMWTVYIVPIRIAFTLQATPADPSFWIDVVVDTFFVCDLGVQSHTYYMSGRSGQWVSNFKKIRRRYFKGWFIVDFVAVFPLDYVIMAVSFHSTGSEARSVRLLRLGRLLRYMRVLKLMNPQKINAVIDHIRDLIGFSAVSMQSILQVFMLTVAFLAFNHSFGLMFIFFGREESAFIEPYGQGGGYWDVAYAGRITDGRGDDPVTIRDQYVDAIYWVMMTVTSIGYGDVKTPSQGNRLYAYGLMLVTAFFYAYILGSFTQLVYIRGADKNLFQAKMRGVSSFLTLIECPRELQARIMFFYTYRFPNKTLFDEHAIFRELPTKLRHEVVKHRFERTILNVPFFRGCSDEVIVDICMRFKGHTAAPGDVLIAAGDETDDLMIIDRGSATGTDGVITVKYTAGSFFSELQFLGVARRAAMDVVADEFSELYSLRYTAIFDVLQGQIELKNKLKEYAKLRSKAMGQQTAAHMALLDATEVEEEHCAAVAFAKRVAESPRGNLEAIVKHACRNGTLIPAEIDWGME